jgi:gamma-glutamylcyclotransferase
MVSDQQGDPAQEPDIDPSAFTALYFGFATNLSPRTFQSRCPGSLYVGIARLKGYRFIIHEHGFGNIVPSKDEKDKVYGALYFMTRANERAMDQGELETESDEKRTVKVQRLEMGDAGLKEIDGAEVDATTYVNVRFTTAGTMVSKENLTFLRRAIDDGLKCGVPKRYFDEHWKKYMPEDESVGRQDEITMVRTTGMDQDDSAKYVPRDLGRLAGKQ